MRRVRFNDVVEVKYFSKDKPTINVLEELKSYNHIKLFITIISFLILLFILSSFIYN